MLPVTLMLVFGLACSNPAEALDRNQRGPSSEQDPAAAITQGDDETAWNGEPVVYAELDGREITGYLSLPEVTDDAAQGLPGMILIHEWWGLNDDIRRQADRFAAEGYVSLAVDLYEGQVTTEAGQARELAASVRSDMERAFSNLQAGIDFLKEHQRVDADRLAAIGWCFGGGWAYQIARNNLSVRASVIYYGPFNPEDDLEIMRAAILGHFAENDRSISVDNVNEFQAKLQTLNGEHEIYIYPNTTHGFASREGENPQFAEEAAQLAHQRTLDFLKRVLQTSENRDPPSDGPDLSNSPD